MLILTSPAKTLDYQSPLTTTRYTLPELLDNSQQLIPASLSLMRISVLICGGVSFRASWINCWELSNSSGSV